MMTEVNNRILIVFGTRPELIKLIPVIKELNKYPEISLFICNTSQHREMVSELLEIFHIKIDYDIDVMRKSQSLTHITQKVLVGVDEILTNLRPRFVMVHGDTTSAYAASVASFYLNIKIIHVEAGLRTYNIHSPFPEEFNRISIDMISSMNFAPTSIAFDNLIASGIAPSKVLVSGNTSVDMIKLTHQSDYFDSNLKWVEDSKFIIITAHRRENLDFMAGMFSAIRKILLDFKEIKAIFPVHMNPLIRELSNNYFKDLSNIRLTEPLNVISFHNIIARAYYVVSDSGGIQEETPSFKIPLVLMRNNTERPEGLEKGILIVGTNEDKIYDSMRRLIQDKEFYESSKPISNPFGDGNASIRIVSKISEMMAEK
jgi:UDP-N-acetylglucosamine 2-epimerase (non-hydrolysing)